MAANRLRREVEKLLDDADVLLDGGRPWDMQVHNEDLFRRVLREGTLGLGEAYMDGWWDCERLDDLFHRVIRAGLQRQFRSSLLLLEAVKARIFNLQSPLRAFRIGPAHYDIGNDLFRRMLDRRMIYSCGYWRNADNLDAAQEAKLDLVARKLDLAPGMKVLDIGCGWGGAARYMVERYDVQVTGITVSEQQAKYAEELCRGLPVEIRLQDYRSLDERFDRVYSLGMFEHVGHKNYRTFMQVVKRHMKENGIFLLHTIGSNRSGHGTDPWIHRYIFPDGMLPSARQITDAVEGLFVLEDWHGFGPDYDRTLLCWFEKFERAWSDLKAAYDERFRRMWEYYLLSCAGSFRARHNQLWQIVFSPGGLPGGYRAPR